MGMIIRTPNAESRRPNLGAAFLALALAWCASPAGAQPDALPNIVLIYMDDLGYGDTSAYGATAIRTPQIDRIAHEGVRFTNGYASSATCTSCGRADDRRSLHSCLV